MIEFNYNSKDKHMKAMGKMPLFLGSGQCLLSNLSYIYGTAKEGTGFALHVCMEIIFMYNIHIMYI